MRKYTSEELKIKAKEYGCRSAFLQFASGHYMSAKRRGVLDEICSHMSKNLLVGKKSHNAKWDLTTLKIETSKYKNRYQFKKYNPSAFNAAKRLCLLEGFYPKRGIFRNTPYSEKEIVAETKIYKNKNELKIKNPYLYKILLKHPNKQWLLSSLPADSRKIKTPHNKKWTGQALLLEAAKYATRTQFSTNSSGAYDAAKTLKILDIVCSHMVICSKEKWNLETISLEAAKYNNRKEFSLKGKGAYNAANKRGILEIVCSHMKSSANSSYPERRLVEAIKRKYPKMQKLRDRKVNISGKPYIQGFDIDIYVPELRKGIEFDGTYWHSALGLKKGRENWPEIDIENYHKIKDEYFKSKGVEILHVSEKEWLRNKQICIDKCLEFLG
jgi:hypothetical protein